MGIMVHSLLWVMQDLYHQAYHQAEILQSDEGGGHRSYRNFLSLSFVVVKGLMYLEDHGT